MERGDMTAGSFSDEERQRYARHFVLPEVGEAGQEKLKRSSVLIVGVGGLGSPAAMYLAAAGVGTLGLADGDSVQLNNLQRQILHGTAQQDRPKVLSGQDRLRDINPHVTTTLYQTTLTSENAFEILRPYDVVIDATDNFPTRYLLNDACVLLGKPDIFASILGFDGYVSVFDARRGPCYRCMFPEPPDPGSVPTCAEGGVLGVLPGIIGSLQASEALKLILGIGDPLIGRVLRFDALAAHLDELSLSKDPGCSVCGTNPTVKHLIDYEGFCSRKDEGSERMEHQEGEISVRRLKERLDKGEQMFLLDVREPYEHRIANLNGHLIPLGQLADKVHELDPLRETIVYCHHGNRSAFAVQMLKNFGFENVRNLVGGIDRWAHEIDPTMQRY